MLFSSIEFLFLFLPMALFCYYFFVFHGSYRGALFVLVIFSLFFYAWWNPAYLFILVFSILFNYLISKALLVADKSQAKKKYLLTVGISGNLLLLGYYKYANFFIENLNRFVDSDFHLETIILPLAISFFTFQQIAFLVDTYRGECKEYKFMRYSLFVVFFPQLIAGPIVHHKEMMPQFKKSEMSYKLVHNNLIVGLSIFLLGLFKKVVLADNISLYATPVFDAAANGVTLSFFEAWVGVLSYSLQLYFDFSGYSDMAIGLALMFGVTLPLNFHSPYKAVNIIDFWRRWHMTLSRFFRDYVYIPLGGNRKGKVRRYTNLMLTMLLAGLWHGASWNFVVWGGLHGFYIIVNHAWHRARNMMRIPVSAEGEGSYMLRLLSMAFTFTLVALAWVPFRAVDLQVTIGIYESMFGMHGISLPALLETTFHDFAWLVQNRLVAFDGMFHNGLADFATGLFYLPILLFIVFVLPNTQQYVASSSLQLNRYSQVQGGSFRSVVWKPNFFSGCIFGMFIFILMTKWISTSPTEFLYFNF